jgi:hypothetical protein
VAKHRIAAGEELDVLNKDELREVIGDFVSAVEDGETELRTGESSKTDANGNVTIAVYAVPPGFSFRVTRLVVDADGFTLAAPFRNPAGAVVVQRSGEMVDGINLQNGLPAISTDSKDTGTRWRNGEIVEVVLVNGPATNGVRVAIQGFLRRHDDRPRGRLRGAAGEEHGQMDAP